MSSPRYCELDEPHDGHEWSLTTPYPSADPKHPSGIDYFYCWGVKDSPDIKSLQRLIKRADRRASVLRSHLHIAAVERRRSEIEFYEGDKS